MRPPLYVGCLVEGCGREHRARGYCHLHYKHVFVEGRDAAHLLPPSPSEAITQARLEDLRFMAETGECLDGAAKRLGISTRGLSLFLTRHDERELMATLQRRNPRDPNATANLALMGVA